MAWYRVGTVNVTNNSNTVVGIGTAWVQAAAIGETFLGPDGGLYEITGINSNTSLSINPAYKGPTSTAQNYALMPTQGYLRDLAAEAAALVASYAAVRDGAGAGKFAAGTEALPSLRGAADENTGVRFAGSDVLQLITNGASRLQLDADGTPTGVTADKLRDRTSHTGTQPITTITGVVGTMAGGAIIERGSNANGEYVRFADGTQICTFASISPMFENTSNLLADWGFPAAFSAIPIAVCNILTPDLAVKKNLVSSAYSASNFSVRLSVLSISQFEASDVTGLILQGVAIGRWK